jgi:hypothetical protein
MMQALQKENSKLAKKLWADLIKDFRAHGIFECVNENNYRKLDTYVVSATNPLVVACKLKMK